MKKDWYKHALYKVHLDMHCPEWHPSIFENFNAQAIVSRVAKSGAEALYFFTKDCYGNAYYKTKVGHKNICMGNRDFLAEICEEAKKVGLPIMAYYTVIWDNFAAAGNPEWRMLNEKGQALTDTITMDIGKWHYVCHNTGYAEYAETMIEEVAANYSVRGFHLDMFNMDFGGLSCYCDTCKAMFKKQTGKDMPIKPAWDQTWREFLEFRYRSVERFAERLRAKALAKNPDLCVVMNYHGSPNFDWRVGQKPVRHSLFSDLGTGETYTPMLGDMYPGMESRYVRNLVPGKPFEMVSWRMNRVTDFTVKPLNQLRWELFTSVVNGGSVMLIDQPFYDGQLDPVAYDRIEEVFKEIKEVRNHLGGEYVKHIAIYYSCANRDLYGRDEQGKFLMPIMGAYKALIESHFAIDFLFDETATQELINQYPVVVLPNVAVLSKKESEMLKQYVKQGGVLISTYDTSLYSETGQKLTNFQLNDVFGVDYVETYDCDTNYLRNPGEEFGKDIDSRYYVLNQGKMHIVKPTTAKGFGDLHDSFFKRIVPDRFFSHNIHPPYKRLTNVLYVNNYGKGKSVYLPHGLDASYADHYELPEHRLLMRNIVKAFSNPPLLEIKASLNVEALVTEKDNKIMIHLVCFNPNRQSATLPTLNKPVRPSIRMEEPAIYKASIELKVPFASAKAFYSDTEVEVKGNEIKIMTDRVYDLIIVEKK